MQHFAIRRLGHGLLLLAGVSVLAFLIMHMAPGGPMAIYANNPYMTSEDLEQMKRTLGLDQPFHVQYWRWVSGVVQGNWGYSYRSGRPVMEAILERLGATSSLTVGAFLLTVFLGIPGGVVSALRRYSALDYATTIMSVIALSLPTFWFGLMVILFFSSTLGWIPSGGAETVGEPFSVLDRLHHLLGPAIVLGITSVATWSRYIRSSMLDVLGTDFIRTARAKGLSERVVIYKHALRNAILPIITLTGLEIPRFFSGALVTETIFSWPGIGRLYVDAINNRDHPVLMGLLMITAVMVLIGNLTADLLYATADPRIRFD